MGIIKSTAKGLVKGISPKRTDIDLQVEEALKDRKIRGAYESYRGNPKDFVEGLRYSIEQENYKNRRLKYAANSLDLGNKAMMPVDATLDAASILAGIGTAAKGLVTLAKLPIYAAYDLYYAGKTHDIKGALKNIGYEAVSWFTPGSLPHLLRHYANQANSIAIKKGSENFLGKLERKVGEAKIVDISKRKRQNQNLEDLSEAA